MDGELLTHNLEFLLKNDKTLHLTVRYCANSSLDCNLEDCKKKVQRLIDSGYEIGMHLDGDFFLDFDKFDILDRFVEYLPNIMDFNKNRVDSDGMVLNFDGKSFGISISEFYEKFYECSVHIDRSYCGKIDLSRYLSHIVSCIKNDFTDRFIELMFIDRFYKLD